MASKKQHWFSSIEEAVEFLNDNFDDWWVTKYDDGLRSSDVLKVERFTIAEDGTIVPLEDDDEDARGESSSR